MIRATTTSGAMSSAVETSLSVLEVNPPLVMRTAFAMVYGKAVPDFEFTSETSELLIELLTLKSVRKLVALLPDQILILSGQRRRRWSCHSR
jgi:hypothetical protein